MSPEHHQYNLHGRSVTDLSDIWRQPYRTEEHYRRSQYIAKVILKILLVKYIFIVLISILYKLTNSCPVINYNYLNFKLMDLTI